MRKPFSSLFPSERRIVGEWVSTSSCVVTELSAAAGFDFVIIDNVLDILVREHAHGRDDGGRAAAPGLLERAALGGLYELVYGDVALLDLIAPVLEHLDAALARDAGQDGAAGDVRRYDLAVYLEHDVHRADFLYVLHVHAVEPEHLGKALLLGLLAGAHARGVVAAAFCVARAAAHRAHVSAFNHYPHRVYAAGIVAAGGGRDDAEEVVVPGVDAELRVRRYDEGAQVEARAVFMRHPALVHGDKGLERLEVDVLRHLGDAHAQGRVVHALYVLCRAEELHRALRRAVGLEALKNLLRVVEHVGAGHKLDGSIGDYARVVPTLPRVIVHEEHVVGEYLAEAELVARDFLLRGGRAGYAYRHAIQSFPQSFPHLPGGCFYDITKYARCIVSFHNFINICTFYRKETTTLVRKRQYSPLRGLLPGAR